MDLRISKRFEFSASHQLAELAEGHPCGRLHGHNYIVELQLSGSPEQLNEAGFVRDFGDLAEFKVWLDAEVDHRHLNDLVPPGQNPSAENLAVWLYRRWRSRFPQLSGVGVSETPKTWAWYQP